LWILMMPSVLKRVLSVKSTDETKKCSALRWTKHQQNNSIVHDSIL
jgi:hypothetical protein